MSDKTICGSSFKSESGLDFLLRVTSKKSNDTSLFALKQLDLDKHLFPNGLKRGERVMIAGPTTSGKTTLIMNLIAKCLTQGSGCILIDTEHTFDVKKILNNLPEQSHSNLLSQLFVLATFSSEELQLNFLGLKHILTANPKIALIIVDSISAFFRQDRVKLNSVRSRDRYMLSMMDQLIFSTRGHNLVTIVVKREPVELWKPWNDINNDIFTCIIQLKRISNDNSNEDDKSKDFKIFSAVVRTSERSQSLQYTITDVGITWSDK